ncbi:cupin domain-containing protein (plasmid) [Haloferacaceae archaeon DSL9]
MTSVVALDGIDGEPHANVFPGAEPKTIRLTLEAGESVPPHDHPDREIVFHLLSGRIRLRLGDEAVDVEEGEIARFDGAQPISPEALEDSRAVIVLANRTDD